jgi:Glycosyltransferase family 87
MSRPEPSLARVVARCGWYRRLGAARLRRLSPAPPARAAWWDAALYGASALLAAVAAYGDYIPLQRQWARLAVVPYAAAAAAAALLAVRWRRRPARRPLRARTALALAVLVGTMLVPLSLEVGWRTRHGDAFHAQSEVLLIEQGAQALVAGVNPYGVAHRGGALAGYPPAVQEHIPYLPGVFAFGLARALLGPGPLTDARVGITLVSLTAALLALLLVGGPGAGRLRALTVLLVLPTGARYLTGGGHDVAVVALLLLALVLEHRRRPLAAGVVIGLAAAVKLTAWLPLPFLALAARDRHGRHATGRFLAAAAVVVGVVVTPFAVWDTPRLLESVLLYPLGLAEPTSARGPTLGRLLAAPFPHAKGVIAAALAAIVVGVGALLLVRRTAAHPRAAAERASVVFTLTVLLATAGRPGYLLYPLNLLVWSRLVEPDDQPGTSRSGTSAEPAGDGDQAAGPVAAIQRPDHRPGQPSRPT